MFAINNIGFAGNSQMERVRRQDVDGVSRVRIGGLLFEIRSGTVCATISLE